MRHIPNALTCCNLLCGCLGIFILERGDVTLIPWLVWAACIFDFLDGFAARMLKVASPIGKELDSLADMVTFGVLPSLFVCDYLRYGEDWWIALIPLVLAVCSALRLAKFNIDTRQVEGFIGVPTPANALFFTGLPLTLEYFHITPPPYSIIVLVLLFSWLMVSPLRLFALKFKHFKWAGNELRFTFLLASVLLIGIFQFAAVTFIIILYILASLVTNWRGTQKT
ncbi:MAG: CDP-diacylglycerol--serine O-phosphatidyltransferase [Bacteroidota bacterium]